MRSFIVLAIITTVLCVGTPASAALPYYNQDLGYTIWLSDDWNEVPQAHLSRFSDLHDGVRAHVAGWEAGYKLSGPASASLLVSEIHGRVVSKASIGNFNSFVVREIQRMSANTPDWSNKGRIRLNKASFDKQKNMLRLELDTTDPAGKQVTSIVYIVYTNGCMLKFVGLAEPGDAQSVAAIDAAVSTLYLDYGLRQ